MTIETVLTSVNMCFTLALSMRYLVTCFAIGALFLKPKITIGVCVYNSSHTLTEAIESIIKQDYPHEFMEVIFVDDGSVDRTLSTIQSFLPKFDMQYKVFHHEWNGLGFSRNVVLSNASGEYIIWVDGDMILPVDHVTKQVEFMEKNQKSGIGKARYISCTDYNTVGFLENVPFIVDDYNGGGEFSTSAKLPGTGGSIFRVVAIKQVGGFDNELTGAGEDQDIAYRVKEAGWAIHRTPAMFCEKRCRTWTCIWNKYRWYGYGCFVLYSKNKRIFSLPQMIPILNSFSGLMYSISAFKMTRRKVVFFLPVYHFFKMSAWSIGFFRHSVNQKKKTNSKKTSSIDLCERNFAKT